MPQPGVVPGFARRDDADERGARVALRIGAIARIPVVVAVERRHVVDRHAGTGAATRQANPSASNSVDRAGAAAAAADVLPEPLAADAERRDDADAGDDDAWSRADCHAASILQVIQTKPVDRRCIDRDSSGDGRGESHASMSDAAVSSALLFVVALAGAGFVLARVWPAAPHRGGRHRSGTAVRRRAVHAVRRRTTACSRATRVKHWLERLVPEPAAALRCTSGSPASCCSLSCFGWHPVGGDLVYDADGLAAVHCCGRPGRWASLLIAARGARHRCARTGRHLRPPATDTAARSAAPYRFVRHPLYLGWVLVVFGAAHMTGDRLAFAAPVDVYLVLAMPWEERSLQRLRGAPYDAIARRCGGASSPDCTDGSRLM